MIVKAVKVYMSESEVKALKKYCVDLNLSMSHFINIAIREKIKRDILNKKNNNEEL